MYGISEVHVDRGDAVSPVEGQSRIDFKYDTILSGYNIWHILVQ